MAGVNKKKRPSGEKGGDGDAKWPGVTSKLISATLRPAFIYGGRRLSG